MKEDEEDVGVGRKGERNREFYRRYRTLKRSYRKKKTSTKVKIEEKGGKYDDVGRAGDFVGLDADEALRDDVEGLVRVLLALFQLEHP